MKLTSKLYAPLALAVTCSLASAEYLHFPANKKLKKNKKIVFVIGDHEYKSERSMPLMANILAARHGFDCYALFSTDKEGKIDPRSNNIEDLKLLKEADLMVSYNRFRCLPDEDMQHIVDYLDSGKPVIGVRTSTHAFNYKSNPDSKFAKYSFDYKGDDYKGGFGKQVLGETWIGHWGVKRKESSRGIFAPGQESHPILKGIKDGEIWGTTDVYEVKLPFTKGCTPILLGQVVDGMTEDSPPLADKDSNSKNHKDRKNSPMMPVSWTYQRPVGEKGRVFTTTIGGERGGTDEFDNAGMRRMFVNACYWTLNLEKDIPEKSDVNPTFKLETNPFKKGATLTDAFKAAYAK